MIFKCHNSRRSLINLLSQQTNETPYILIYLDPVDMCVLFFQMLAASRLQQKSCPTGRFSYEIWDIKKYQSEVLIFKAWSRQPVQKRVKN